MVDWARDLREDWPAVLLLIGGIILSPLILLGILLWMLLLAIVVPIWGAVHVIHTVSKWADTGLYWFLGKILPGLSD